MDVYQEAEQLKRVPMFAKLDPSWLKLLAFTSEAIDFHPGEILFHEGDMSDSAYVIMEGEVEVLMDTEEGEAIPVVKIGRNELLGEMAVLSNSPRSATLRAQGEVKTLRIANDMFLRLISENPSVALDVMRQLTEKLARSPKQVEALQGELQRLHRKSLN